MVVSGEITLDCIPPSDQEQTGPFADGRYTQILVSLVRHEHRKLTNAIAHSLRKEGSIVVETLVSLKRRKPRRVIFVGYVAGSAWHAGTAAGACCGAVPRPVGMHLAHPARVAATRALRPLTRRLATHIARHALTRADVLP